MNSVVLGLRMKPRSSSPLRSPYVVVERKLSRTVHGVSDVGGQFELNPRLARSFRSFQLKVGDKLKQLSTY